MKSMALLKFIFDSITSTSRWPFGVTTDRQRLTHNTIKLTGHTYKPAVYPHGVLDIGLDFVTAFSTGQVAEVDNARVSVMTDGRYDFRSESIE